MAPRRRLDTEMVRRGVAASRQRAQALIADRQVLVNGAPATKPAHLVSPDDAVVVRGPKPRYVGRGGTKLEAGLAAFGVEVAGQRCLDAGASTGGFTDCLLQAGAAQVVAVDVGYGQLHETLRADRRVRNLERTNIRTLEPRHIGGMVDLVVADLSFISVRTVLAGLVDMVSPGGSLILLVKPQFEAGRAEADKGKGVIRDPEVWERVLAEAAAAATAAGAPVVAGIVSPITGAEGNVEFLLWLVRDSTAGTPFDPAALASSAVPAPPSS